MTNKTNDIRNMQTIHSFHMNIVSNIFSASIRVAQVIKWTLSPDIVSTGIDWVGDRNQVLLYSSYLLSRLMKRMREN